MNGHCKEDFRALGNVESHVLISLYEPDCLVVGGDPQTHLLEVLNGSDEFMHRKILCKWKKPNQLFLFVFFAQVLVFFLKQNNLSF